MSHDPAEIIIKRWFGGNHSGFFDDRKVQKQLFEKSFCNNIKVSHVTFDQCNTSLLNKNITFF